MELMSTGFPELDKLLEARIQPSCICVSGEFNSDQRNFVLQLIHNFLKNGLKGLYVCLDRPANEVRNQFKRLGLEISSYDEEYSLFFIDFFSYSQKVLIETSTLTKLAYKPNQLLETLYPFLDWIKNGFILIDSFSTLTLNMDAKEAYDFVRGIKLLGRAFNLIIIGITYIPATDPKIWEIVRSNSDGNLVFKGETLLIDHFENINVDNKVLLISKNEVGKITLKSVLSEGATEKTGINLLALLAESVPLKTTPLMILAATPKTEGSIKELLPTLKTMEEEKILKTTPYCSSVCCLHCNAQTLEFYLQCPECENRLLEKGGILEHLSCGHTDFESNFKLDGKLVCPKCSKELKQIGVDYRRLGVGYRCVNKHLFSSPRIIFVCSECKETFDLNEAKIENQYTYELTEKGKRQAKNAGY